MRICTALLLPSRWKFGLLGRHARNSPHRRLPSGRAATGCRVGYPDASAGRAGLSTSSLESCLMGFAVRYYASCPTRPFPFRGRRKGAPSPLWGLAGGCSFSVAYLAVGWVDGRGVFSTAATSTLLWRARSPHGQVGGFGLLRASLCRAFSSSPARDVSPARRARSRRSPAERRSAATSVVSRRRSIPERRSGSNLRSV